MSTRFPWLDAVLAGGSSLCVAGLCLLPPTPYLQPRLWPGALGLSAVWLLWRLWWLDRALAFWQAWRVSPSWEVAAEDLPRLDGLLLGKGYRWTGQQTQALETVLAQDGALPTASDSRGGYPGLHLVGQEAEDHVILPWSELPGQMMLLGTTRSGKTNHLQSIVVQLIRA